MFPRPEDLPGVRPDILRDITRLAGDDFPIPDVGTDFNYNVKWTRSLTDSRKSPDTPIVSKNRTSGNIYPSFIRRE